MFGDRILDQLYTRYVYEMDFYQHSATYHLNCCHIKFACIRLHANRFSYFLVCLFFLFSLRMRSLFRLSVFFLFFYTVLFAVISIDLVLIFQREKKRYWFHIGFGSVSHHVGRAMMTTTSWWWWSAAISMENISLTASIMPREICEYWRSTYLVVSLMRYSLLFPYRFLCNVLSLISAYVSVYVSRVSKICQWVVNSFFFSLYFSLSLALWLSTKRAIYFAPFKIQYKM